uniref:Modulator of smoothened n=1 Tax=Paramormyrops kingsleyae TaxID=1676925 RepID=A0A3B3T2E8_9TELE
MDKLTIISGCLFLAADIFAIASIANPDWINTGESAGALTVGLVRQCQTIHGRDRTCIPPRLPPEWVTTLFFIVMGIVSLTVTCGLLVASHWHREATKYARWIAFTGMVLFCMAALIFPIGFYISESCYEAWSLKIRSNRNRSGCGGRFGQCSGPRGGGGRALENARHMRQRKSSGRGFHNLCFPISHLFWVLPWCSCSGVSESTQGATLGWTMSALKRSRFSGPEKEIRQWT